MQQKFNRNGDVIKVEIKDFARKVIYKCKFNLYDKNSIIHILKVIEKYSGHSIPDIINEQLKIGEWF